MTDASRPSAPFYERNPSLPPPLPLLTAQTDVFYHLSSPPPILAQEDISHVLTSCREKSDHAANPIRGIKPLTPVKRSVTFLRPKTPGDSDSSGGSDTDVRKIPQPQGEAGRPGSGGYNIEIAMGWKAKQYTKLRVSRISFPCLWHL